MGLKKIGYRQPLNLSSTHRSEEGSAASLPRHGGTEFRMVWSAVRSLGGASIAVIVTFNFLIGQLCTLMVVVVILSEGFLFTVHTYYYNGITTQESYHTHGITPVVFIKQ